VINLEPLIMAIESSCDETSVAILKGKNDLLSNIVVSQIDIHKEFGGVVPEVAARKHIEFIDDTVKKALNDAGVSIEQIDAFAVTVGPGLVGALLVGLNYAKGLALSQNKPLIGVNHLMGHIYANFLAFDTLTPPFIILLVSGGHTMILKADSETDFKIIGETKDDAAGEAFDKVSKILGLGYPGGPVIDEYAKKGILDHKFPKPLYYEGYDFSFSGLKTSVLYYIRDNEEYNINNVAASFQESVVDTLIHKLIRYSDESGINNIVIAGGVAANSFLRKKLEIIKDKNIYIPPMKFCTDNAAMIARAAYEKYVRNMFSDLSADAVPNLTINEI